MRKITPNAITVTGWDKVRGLIGSKKPRFLFLNTRFGIHTFFLKFPIDVVVLDKNNSVVKIKQNLIPNKVFFWNPKYNKVHEMPGGSVKKLGINFGTILE